MDACQIFTGFFALLVISAVLYPGLSRADGAPLARVLTDEQ
jgi:hypothetical protein